MAVDDQSVSTCHSLTHFITYSLHHLLTHTLTLYIDYFITRHLYPNIDFYSGIIYKAMGFPTEFFPVLFSIARTAGWLAHWREQTMVLIYTDFIHSLLIRNRFLSSDPSNPIMDI